MKPTPYILYLFILISNPFFAQGGWQNIYPIQSNSPYGDGIESVRQTPDGGYILAGLSEMNSSASQNRIVKVNDQGIIQWSSSYTTVGSYSWATNIELAAGGGYFVEGYRTNPVTYAREIYLQRLDANGNQLWLNIYPQSQISTKGDATDDGGYIQIGYFDNASIQDTISIIKTDASGNLQWLRKYPNTGTGVERIPTSIIQTSNQEYVIGGYQSQSFGGLNFLWRLNTDGDSLWQNTYGESMSHPEYIGQVLELGDGSLVSLSNDALSFGVNDVYLFKTDASGSLIWEKHYGQNNAFGTHLDATADGGFILTGYQLASALYRILLIKTDDNGNQQWLKTFNGMGSGSWKSYCVEQTTDGGYILGGARIQSAYTRLNMYLIKTDSFGEIYGNTIQGYIYADANFNCINDNGEYALNNWIVKAEGEQTFITSSDEQGFYSMRVDTGNYQVTLHPPANSVYWQPSTCSNDTFLIAIDQQLTTIDTSFAQTAEAFCPLLNVELGVPFLRRCFNNTYVIHYCNSGTAPAENANIHVTFDDFLIVDTASINVPFNQIDSFNFQFNIGQVDIGECGSIPVTVLVSCNALLGQTHCSNAEIFPSESCLEPIWQGPFLTLDAECSNDSAMFTVVNTGASMLSSVNYTLYENGVIIDLGTIQLQSGNSQEIGVLAGENFSYRIDVNQVEGLPALLGDPTASIAITGCNTTDTDGWVTQFYNYDGSPFLDIDCHQNIGAYDPNDKNASPVGYGDEHYIEENTDLEYLIRFQNTGTDTAFTIVIRDTISGFLDITSLQPGSSSHSYTWRIYGENTQAVEFTFNNIMLPDSFVNEPASNGFIKYRIKQINNNPIGSVINNQAAIYFDFNEPIFTNTTFHEIGADFIPEELITHTSDQVDHSLGRINVYPNPSSDILTIDLKLKSGKSQFEILDIYGHLIHSWQSEALVQTVALQAWDLSSGVYVLQVRSADGQVSRQKWVYQK